jgi:GNAT superfamily N-acetyltransferase
MTSVRPASDVDATAIGQVHVRAWQSAYRGIMPDVYLDGLSALERAGLWRDVLARANPEQMTLVAEGPQGIVGFASGGLSRRPPDADVCELYVLNVEPTVWRRGTGSLLLAAFEAWSAGRGYRETELWVAVENQRARSFYERRGWRDTGEVEDDEILGVTLRQCRYRRARLSYPGG